MPNKKVWQCYYCKYVSNITLIYVYVSLYFYVLHKAWNKHDSLHKTHWVDIRRRTPFCKCVCEIRRNKVLELCNATLSSSKKERPFGFILHCTQRTQNKAKISQCRLLPIRWNLISSWVVHDCIYYFFRSSSSCEEDWIFESFNSLRQLFHWHKNRKNIRKNRHLCEKKVDNLFREERNPNFNSSSASLLALKQIG